MNDTETLKWLDAWLKSQGANVAVTFGWNPTLEKFTLVYLTRIMIARTSNGTLVEMIGEFRQAVDPEQGH